MALDYVDITGPIKTTQNVGGTTKRWRWSDIDDFTTIQAKPELSDASPPSNPKDLITISANHVWKFGKGYYEGYMTRDTGKVDLKMNQARDTTGVEMTAELFIPGADDVTQANLMLLANSRTLVWFELASGLWIQFGSARWPAEVKFDWASGSNASVARAWKVSVMGFETTMQYYAGTFTKHP